MNCPYCNEKMVYGKQIQVLHKSNTDNNGIRTSKEIHYEQLGWRCSMKDDNCDIIFDDKNTGTNKINFQDALKKIQSN